MESETNAWTVVEIGFEGADETINFGYRAVSEEQLYETRTLATISPEIKVSSNSKIHSILSNEKSYLAIDNTFLVLTNGCTESEAMVVLPDCVEQIALVKNRLVALLLGNGDVQYLDLDNDGDIVYSSKTSDIISVFADDYSDGYAFILIYKSGKVCRLTMETFEKHQNGTESVDSDENIGKNTIKCNGENKTECIGEDIIEHTGKDSTECIETNTIGCDENNKTECNDTNIKENDIVEDNIKAVTMKNDITTDGFTSFNDDVTNENDGLTNDDVVSLQDELKNLGITTKPIDFETSTDSNRLEISTETKHFENETENLKTTTESKNFEISLEQITMFENKQILHGCLLSHGAFAISGPKLFAIIQPNVINRTNVVTTKSKIYDNGQGLVLSLNDDGHLIGTCQETLLTYVIFDDVALTDFIFVKDETTKDSHILGLTKPDENSDYFIQCIGYPTFDTIYRLKVEAETYLVETSSCTEEMIYIEGVTSNNIVQQLKIKVISACDPAARLKRMLQRGKFDEAEKFAETWKLNVEPVWRARVQLIVDSSSCDIETLEHLFCCLDQVKDIKFVVDCCIDTTADCLDGVRKLFSYCRRRIRSLMVSNPQDKRLWRLLDKTESLVHRLDTFSLLHLDSSMLDWERFSRCNVVQCAEQLAQQGLLNKSALVLTRAEESVIKKSLCSSEKVRQFLDTAPEDVEIQQLVSWFRAVFIRIATTIPGCLDAFINWLINRLERLETSTNCAGKALTLAECILEVTNTVSLRRQCSSNSTALERIQNIVIGMQQVEKLCTVHQISITLSEYLQGGVELVEWLLSSVGVKGVKKLYNEFLAPYMRQNRIPIDETFARYITEASDSDSAGGWWETYAVEVIQCISGRDVRLRTTIKLLQTTDVPWSETISQFVNDTLNAGGSHPLCDEIRRQRDDVPFKMLLSKYVRTQCNIRHLSDSQILQLARKVLRSENNKDELSHNLTVIINKFPKMSSWLKIQLLLHLTAEQHFDEALEYMNTLTTPQLLLSWQIFIDRILQGNNDGLVELIGPLHRRIKENTPIIEHSLYEQQLNEVRRYREFGSTSNDLHELVLCVGWNDSNWPMTVSKVKRIARLSGLSQTSALLELSHQTAGNLSVITAICESVADSTDWNELVTWAGLAILKCCEEDDDEVNMSDDVPNTLNATLAKWDSDSNKKGESAARCIRLAEELSERAVTLTMEESNGSLLRICDLFRWINSMKWIRGMDSWSYSNINVPETGEVAPLAAVSMAKDMFTIYAALVAKYPTGLNFPMLPLLDDFVEDQMVFLFETLPSRVQQLLAESNDLPALQLIQTLCVSVQNLSAPDVKITEWINRLNNIWNAHVAPLVLHKLLRKHQIDWELCLSILKRMGHVRAHAWIKRALVRYRMDVQNFSAVASLGLRYVQTLNVPGDTHIGYRDIQLRCKWWLKCFNNLGASLPYIEHFQIMPQHLLQLLLNSNEATLPLITKFCKDFDLDLQPYLPLHLRNILIKFKPTDVTTPIKTASQLTSECRKVVAQIDVATIGQLLQTVWNEVSYYSYEVHLCILELLRDLNLDKKQEPPNELLLFLCRYKRICEPQQREVDDWQKHFPQAPEFDPLAQYRLPHLPNELLSADHVWRLLRPEVNLDTYRTWFDASHIFRLDKNDICAYAIKGTLATGVLSKNPDDKYSWQLEPQHPDVIEKIAECASLMTDLEMATAVLYQNTLTCVSGADLCALARHCWETCNRWMESTTPPAECIERVKRRHLGCHTEHVLHQHRLANEKYIKLVCQPEQLISMLYQDERIIKRSGFAIELDCPHVNEAVDQIAKVHSLNVDEIREMIIERLLQVDFCGDTLEALSEVPEENALVYICYICESGDENRWSEFLIKRGRGQINVESEDEQDDGPLTLGVRVLALRCANVLIGDGFGAELGDLLKTLHLLKRLERVGIALNEDELSVCDKPELIRRLASRYSHHPLAAPLMMELCVRYNLQDPLLWELVLKRCMQIVNVKLTQECLTWLAQQKHIASGSTYAAVWMRLIDYMIATAVVDTTEDNKWAEALMILQQCPDTSRLDIVKICETCLQNKRPECTVTLLPYIQDLDIRINLIKKLSSIESNHLQQKLRRLESLGVLTARLGFEMVLTNRQIDDRSVL